MAPLTFFDTHNMIEFLTKSDATIWTSVLIKKTNDVVRLQALIDRKKVIITEDIIRQAHRLDDADGIDCLPNEEIFTELARMGYEKPSIKLTFYKAFFSAQWKLLIHTILQCMSAKRTAWNEFSSSMASAIICLATGNDLSTHTTKYTSPALTQKDFSNMRRIGKVFSGVDTPLFDGMLVPQQVQDVEDATEDEDADNEVSAEPTPPSSTPATPSPTPTQEHIPSSPQAQTAQPSSPPPQTLQTNEISMTLLNTLLETCATLTKQVANLEQDKVAQAIEITKLKQRVRREVSRVLSKEEVIEVDTATKLITEVVTTALTTITAAQVPMASTPRRRRGVLIQDSEETTTTSVIMHSEVKSKDKGKCQKEKEGSKRKGENLKQDAAKKQKINEETEELKTHLQIVANDNDDVYTEATPLALKVPVVDYQIHHEHNKPYYKIIRADEPKNYSDDFLLNTLKIMFEKPNVEAIIWRDQRGRYRLEKVKSWKLFESCGVHILTLTTTQMILLVEKKYPLTRFTLEQMLNNARLEVEEESKRSLELPRLVRRQLQEGYIPE
uniref:Synaptobrevin, longin-like domain protein n=1 Tax=Tanacetum cinerariifolium TaxID=118510 RepID=A0A6L2MX85_TANCI|nr:hypothetical protein [Tanacetum cinerariifolium]